MHGTFCSMYLPKYHPLNGIHLMKLGKIQLLITEHPRSALETLHQVSTICVYMIIL